MPLPRTVGTGRALRSGVNPNAYTNKLRGLAPIAYWPLADVVGASAVIDASGFGRNGVYSGVALGTPGIGDGRTSAAFDANSSIVNVYSSSLASALNGNEGSIIVWAKVGSLGAWSDGNFREIVRLAVDGSNIIFIDKSSVANSVRFGRIAGGTVKTVTTAAPAGTIGFFHLAMTWSVSGNSLLVYVNGVQIGAAQTSIGTFVGSLGSSLATIGDISATPSPSTNWNGSIAHVALYSSVLTPNQVASTAVLY